MKPPHAAAHRASRLRLLELEPRILFDGAAAVDVVHDLAAADAAAGAAADAASAVPQGPADLALPAPVVTALSEAQELVQGVAAQQGAVDTLVQMFQAADAPAADAAWRAQAAQALQDWADGSAPVRIELRSAADMQGALGGYAAQGPDGQPVIYLNADYAATASTAALRAVLLEEIGHSLDNRLNGDADTPGDEGHAFASLLTAGAANAVTAGAQDDQGTVMVDGQAVAVEQAAPYAVAQIHYVPLPEPDIKMALSAIASGVSGNIETVIAISATSNGTVVIYDHWEDGYEADINNPLQATTQVWGDNDASNGYLDLNNNGSFDAGEDTLTAGQSIVLRNASTRPARPRWTMTAATRSARPRRSP
ncbi:MAG: hypothetical protein HZB72_09625 [Burkholderiales bacterium]|nr:hypothetical protein [Burkholderiales bacterium]